MSLTSSRRRDGLEIISPASPDKTPGFYKYLLDGRSPGYEE
jgi:hypothetical protein